MVPEAEGPGWIVMSPRKSMVGLGDNSARVGVLHPLSRSPTASLSFCIYNSGHVSRSGVGFCPESP